MGDIKDQSWAQNFAFYKRKSLKQGIALTGRNHTGPSCSVGRPTTHTPGRGGTDLSTRPAAGTHGRKSRGKQGGRVPQNLEWEDAKICKLSPDFVMLFQNFTHQITCITMQRSKKRINPIILTARLFIFPKNASSISTKSPLRAENSTFFWQGHEQEVPLRMHQNTPFKVIWGRHSPLPRPLSRWEGVPTTLSQAIPHS